VAGAAINCYYQAAFVGVIVADKHLAIEPGKLYQWTKTRTVEDGCLAGAALGLAASMPTLFMRRPAIPRWTRCLGMANIGACAGVLACHGYVQYTGERQKAYKLYAQRLKARPLEFWNIFWDKELMAQFDPLIQHYIRHTGMWHASNLPMDTYQQLEYEDESAASDAGPHTGASVGAEPLPEAQLYYKQPYDYSKELEQVSVAATLAKIEEVKAEKQALFKEAEYLMAITLKKQHEVYHTRNTHDSERRRLLLLEVQLCETAYYNLYIDAVTVDMRLANLALSLSHRAAMVADTPWESWLPTSLTLDHATHDPAFCIDVIASYQSRIAAEVESFEHSLARPAYSAQQKERLRRDLEDGRVFLRAADRVLWELEEKVKMVERDRLEGGKKMDVGKKAANPSDASLEPEQP
jgi:hypothetical protein